MRKETVSYGADPVFQVLDCYGPDPLNGPRPVVVGIHGGGWQNGNRHTMEFYGQFLVEAGYAVILPNYRLTGTHGHPAQIEDLEAVLAWIAREGTARGLDRTRVGLTGISAGGHLTALLGLRATRQAEAPCRIRCMIPICGVHDMGRWLIEKPDYLSCGVPFLGGQPEDRKAILQEASPIFQIHPQAPPCLCTHGIVDEVVPLNQSELFVEALQQAGCSAGLIRVPGAGHTGAQPNTQPPEPLGGWPPLRNFLKLHLA